MQSTWPTRSAFSSRVKSAWNQLGVETIKTYFEGYGIGRFLGQFDVSLSVEQFAVLADEHANQTPNILGFHACIRHTGRLLGFGEVYPWLSMPVAVRGTHW